jgi:hypothetical protein
VRFHEEAGSGAGTDAGFQVAHLREAGARYWSFPQAPGGAVERSAHGDGVLADSRSANVGRGSIRGIDTNIARYSPFFKCFLK